MDAHRDVKRVMIALAEELGVTFCAYVILHAIGRAQNVDDLVQYGANTALGKFNEFLAERNDEDRHRRRHQPEAVALCQEPTVTSQSRTWCEPSKKR